MLAMICWQSDTSGDVALVSSVKVEVPHVFGAGAMEQG
jgi:hypothetical protein